jgi:hypothetical protein
MDLINTWKQRKMSWSQIASWEYDKEQWYSKYILGEEQSTNAQMLFGNVIGQKLASDPSFLPQVLRYKVFEKEFNAKLSDFVITGYLDSYCPDTYNFYEYKTSSNPNKWTQKSVNSHGQLVFYKALIYLCEKIRPENIKCKLFYIPVNQSGGFEMELTKNAKIQSFDFDNTTTIEVLKFLNYIKKTRKQMESYAQKRLLA